MLARVRTALRLSDLVRAALDRSADPVAALEQAFAERFGFAHGLLFPYGRVAIHALLTGSGWQNREVLCPAYTCVVVPDAVAASGNQVVYVDSAPDHFLPRWQDWQAAATPQTAMAIITPLFGYPVDKTCDEAIRARAPGAFILYDEAQSYGTTDKDGLQLRDADGALFSLGLGKLITSLSGGMLLLRDDELYRSVRAVRDRYSIPGLDRTLVLIAKGIAAWAAYREPAVSLLDRLPLLSAEDSDSNQSETSGLPSDGRVRASSYQAQIGLGQFDQLSAILADRRRIGEFYEEKLARWGFRIFAHTHRPTWPRFPFPVADRDATIRALRAAKIQCGLFLSSACTDMPNAKLWARTMINLPNWTGMTITQAAGIVDALARLRDANPAAVAWPQA